MAAFLVSTEVDSGTWGTGSPYAGSNCIRDPGVALERWLPQFTHNPVLGRTIRWGVAHPAVAQLRDDSRLAAPARRRSEFSAPIRSDLSRSKTLIGPEFVTCPRDSEGERVAGGYNPPVTSGFREGDCAAGRIDEETLARSAAEITGRRGTDEPRASTLVTCPACGAGRGDITGRGICGRLVINSARLLCFIYSCLLHTGRLEALAVNSSALPVPERGVVVRTLYVQISSRPSE